MKHFALFLFLSFPLFAQDEESEALKAMRLSCEKQKVGLGCFNYANMLLRLDKSDEADKYFEMGCKLEHSPSCSKEKWDLPLAKVPSKPEPMAPESEAVPEAVVGPEPETEPAPAPESLDLSLEPESTINE
jgi:hypothetical protein